MNFGDYVYLRRFTSFCNVVRETKREDVRYVHIRCSSWKVKNRGDGISCCYRGIQNTVRLMRGWKEGRR